VRTKFFENREFLHVTSEPIIGGPKDKLDLDFAPNMYFSAFLKYILAYNPYHSQDNEKFRCCDPLTIPANGLRGR
jgi:hypothetical protein